jgi:hypothetical protein
MASSTILSSPSLRQYGSGGGPVLVLTVVSIALILAARLDGYDLVVSPQSSYTNVGFDVCHLESSPAYSDLVVGRPMLISTMIAPFASSVSKALLFNRLLGSSLMRFAGGEQPPLVSASEVSTELLDLGYVWKPS